MKKKLKDKSKKHPPINYDDYDDEVVFDEDNPEITEEMFKNARPAREVLIEQFGKENAELLIAGKVKIRSIGRPVSETPKKQITLRLDQQIIEKFRSHGKGWQSEINVILLEWLKKHEKKTT